MALNREPLAHRVGHVPAGQPSEITGIVIDQRFAGVVKVTPHALTQVLEDFGSMPVSASQVLLAFGLAPFGPVTAPRVQAHRPDHHACQRGGSAARIEDQGTNMHSWGRKDLRVPSYRG